MQIMKQGGGTVMVWDSFTWQHVGSLVKIIGIMKKKLDRTILQTNLPKEPNFRTLRRPAESPELNTIENLWAPLISLDSN